MAGGELLCAGSVGAVAEVELAVDQPWRASSPYVVGRDRLAVDRDETAADHRLRVERVSRRAMQPLPEGVALLGLHVDDEAVRRVLRRRLAPAAIRSVRSSDQQHEREQAHARAETCSTAKAGRAAIWRVASTSQRGARASGTARAQHLTASHDQQREQQTAPAKPPTAMRPSFRSLETASSSARSRARRRRAPRSRPASARRRRAGSPAAAARARAGAPAAGRSRAAA